MSRCAAALSARGGIGLGQLTICVLGVLVITTEYSTGVIRASLLAVPRRVPMLIAKIVVCLQAADGREPDDDLDRAQRGARVHEPDGREDRLRRRCLRWRDWPLAARRVGLVHAAPLPVLWPCRVRVLAALNVRGPAYS